MHPLSTGPSRLLPFLPVLPYSLSLSSQSAFLLIAHLQASVTLREYKKSLGICSVFSIKIEGPLLPLVEISKSVGCPQIISSSAVSYLETATQC